MDYNRLYITYINIYVDQTMYYIIWLYQRTPKLYPHIKEKQETTGQFEALECLGAWSSSHIHINGILTRWVILRPVLLHSWRQRARCVVACFPTKRFGPWPPTDSWAMLETYSAIALHTSTFKFATPKKTPSLPETFLNRFRFVFLNHPSNQRWGPRHSAQRSGEITVEAVDEDQGLKSDQKRRIEHGITRKTQTKLVGGWPTPSEKWWSESQLGLWHSQYMEKQNSCSKPPTSNGCWEISSDGGANMTTGSFFSVEV